MVQRVTQIIDCLGQIGCGHSYAGVRVAILIEGMEELDDFLRKADDLEDIAGHPQAGQSFGLGHGEELTCWASRSRINTLRFFFSETRTEEKNGRETIVTERKRR